MAGVKVNGNPYALNRLPAIVSPKVIAAFEVLKNAGYSIVETPRFNIIDVEGNFAKECSPLEAIATLMHAQLRELMTRRLLQVATEPVAAKKNDKGEAEPEKIRYKLRTMIVSPVGVTRPQPTVVAPPAGLKI